LVPSCEKPSCSSIGEINFYSDKRGEERGRLYMNSGWTGVPTRFTKALTASSDGKKGEADSGNITEVWWTPTFLLN
jgi:hypothetical protein